MRIYFCGSIAAGRKNLPAYQHIVGRLKGLGHHVLTEHVADPDVPDSESAIAPRRVFERDVAWMLESDVVIAEVSTPSLGVGYEIASALQMGKPTLCVYRHGLQISKMITGNTSPTMTLATWDELPDLDRHIETFLAGNGGHSSFPRHAEGNTENAERK
jgi:hypothetical protein